MPILRAHFHFPKCIADVGVRHFVKPHGLGIVRHNRDHLHALAFVVVDDLLDALFIILRGRAVVTRENDDEHLRIGEIFQGVRFPVSAGQTKIRRGGTQLQGRRQRRAPECRCEEKKQWG